MLTVDEFWRQYQGQPFELVKGEIVRLPEKEYTHELVTSRVRMCLGVHVEAAYLGEVFGDGARFALAANELRAVDAGFVSNERLATITDPEAYLPFAPELMIEVVSARYTSTEIQEKVELFLNAGSLLVWVVDPHSQTVTVCTARGDVMHLNSSEQLTGSLVLADFSIRVSDFFPPLKLP